MSITPSPSSVNLQAYTQTDYLKKPKKGTDSTLYYFLKISILCLLWYCSSAANSITLKKCLKIFPYPLTLTCVQLLGCATFTAPLMKFIRLAGAFRIAKGVIITGILPLCIGKISALFFATVSISNIPVSYSNTVKASLPLFSVIFSRLLLGQRHSFPIYVSLLVIMVGVVISSFTEILFDFFGLISALLSTISTALLSTYSKKSMKDNNLHHLKMLYFVSCCSFVLMFPLWAVTDATSLLSFDFSKIEADKSVSLIPSIMVISLTNFLQNVAAFGLLSLVTPVSYAVANCSKRVFVIGMSLVLLRNPVTYLNICGMVTAITGVGLYNKFKFEEMRRERELNALPTHVSAGMAPPTPTGPPPYLPRAVPALGPHVPPRGPYVPPRGPHAPSLQNHATSVFPPHNNYLRVTS